MLADRQRPLAEREVALKYIVHLVGDLQQPLHGTDATGSGIKVVFNGKAIGLHEVWDDGIIDAHGGTAAQIADALIHAEKGVPSGGGPLQWAEESRTIAQTQIYNTVPRHPTSVVVLPPDYASAQWPTVAQRLTQGGWRLARILNAMLQ